MKITKINLPEDVVTKLERLTYESTSIKDNICFLLTQYKNDPTFLESDMFKAYTEKQVAKEIEFANAKQEMADQYLPADATGTWEVDFKTKELVIKG